MTNKNPFTKTFNIMLLLVFIVAIGFGYISIEYGQHAIEDVINSAAKFVGL